MQHEDLWQRFSRRRNRNEYLFEENPELYLYFGLFFICSLLIITWSYFECQGDGDSVLPTKHPTKAKRKKKLKKNRP